MLNLFKSKSKKNYSIIAPISGTMIELSKVPDQVFASGMMGDGVGIIPDGNVFVAPAAGVVTVIPETKHAFGLTLDNGIELLVHIGLDTVQFKGQGFKTLVDVGKKVNCGDPIIEVDLEYFNKLNISLITPIVIVNLESYEIKEVYHGKNVIGGQTSIIELQKQ